MHTKKSFTLFIVQPLTFKILSPGSRPAFCAGVYSRTSMIFTCFSQNLNKKVNILTRDVKVLDTRVGNLEETTQRIDKRLDNTININIARILNEQTAMRREMNEKFDRLILQEEQRRVYG